MGTQILALTFLFETILYSRLYCIAGVNNVLADALSRGKKVNTGMVNKHVSEMVKEINLADVFDTF